MAKYVLKTPEACSTASPLEVEFDEQLEPEYFKRIILKHLNIHGLLELQSLPEPENVPE